MNTGFIPPYKPRPVLPTDFVAIAVVVRGDCRLLVSKRLNKAVLGDLWEFPGGKRLPGESYAECAVRETLEETGVNAEPVRELLPIRHDYEKHRVVLQPYVCRYLSGEATALESAEVRWVLPSELHRLEMPAANIALIARLMSEPDLLEIPDPQ